MDSEDGIGLVDDDMEALLPKNCGLSDDLCHVSKTLNQNFLNQILNICVYLYINEKNFKL